MRQISPRVRNWMIVGLGVILGLLVAYFAGYASEHAARLRDARATAQLETKFEGAQAQVASLQSINALLTAHVWVCRAAVALDNRNFGIANDATAKAVTSLKMVNPKAAALEEKSVEAVRREASGVRISVAANLASQRTQLLHLADSIDALVQKSQATAIGGIRAPHGPGSAKPN